jgi:hypothetical protein
MADEERSSGTCQECGTPYTRRVESLDELVVGVMAAAANASRETAGEGACGAVLGAFVCSVAGPHHLHLDASDPAGEVAWGDIEVTNALAFDAELTGYSPRTLEQIRETLKYLRRGPTTGCINLAVTPPREPF